MKPFIVIALKGEVKNADDLMAICDGFSMGAMLFSGLWFLWRGMWFHALVVFLAIGGIIVWFITMPMSVLSFITPICLAILLGFESRYFYIEHVLRNGAVALDYIAAKSEDMAIGFYLLDNPVKGPESDNLLSPISSYENEKTYHNDMIFGSNFR